mgnify:CR=1 FL=1
MRCSLSVLTLFVGLSLCAEGRSADKSWTVTKKGQIRRILGKLKANQKYQISVRSEAPKPSAVYLDLSILNPSIKATKLKAEGYFGGPGFFGASYTFRASSSGFHAFDLVAKTVKGKGGKVTLTVKDAELVDLSTIKSDWRTVGPFGGGPILFMNDSFTARSPKINAKPSKTLKGFFLEGLTFKIKMTSSDVTPAFSIYDPRGKLEGYYPSASTIVIVNHRAKMSGMYRIVLTTKTNGQTGRYKLEMSR